MKIHQVENKQDLIWFGSEAPETWNVIRLRFLIEHKTNQVPGKQAGDFYIELEDIESKTGKLIASDREKSPESSVKVFEQGDVLFGRLRPYLAKGWVAKQSGSCVGEILVFRPKDGTDKEFFGYRILADDFIRFVNSAAYGAKMPRIGWPFLADVRIPLPSATEQHSIARFLDHKTALIDQYIANKKKQIELLEKLRTAIISEAVTQGLNPDVEMKDSGVEWLGVIPKHWKVRRTRFICSITTGGKDTVNREDDGAYPFFVRSDNVERISTYSFDGESVLTSGDGAGVAKVFHYYSGKFDFHQRMYSYRHFRGIKAKYFYYYLKINLANEVFKYSAKSTVDSLRLPMLKNFPFSIPDENEQEQIIEYLDEKNAELDAVVRQLEGQIEQIQNYRTSLISEAVTGKIDVRDFKPEPLPHP